MEHELVTRPKVGIVGFGAMGAAMARNLQRRRYSVAVRDISPQAQALAQQEGMVIAASPAELAAAVDVVAVVVVNAAQISDVLFGTPECPGLVAGCKPGQTVLLCSTIAPEDAIAFANQLATHGLCAIDAPISGGPARALSGEMSMMLAGPEATLRALEPLLCDLAKNRFHLGDRVGDASKAKLVNNLLAGIHLAAAAEALALGVQIGLAPDTIFDIVCASSGNSWIFQDRMARAIADDFAPRAAVPVLTKDLGLATALAAAHKAHTPLGAVALAQFKQTTARGWADLDDAAILKTYLAENAASALDDHPG